MKIIPALFSTQMVQPILEGRKTKTRRVNGLELINDDPDWYIWLNEYPQAEIPRPARPYDDRYYYAFTGKNSNRVLTVTHCPYGKPGDILWVRESWRIRYWDFDCGEYTVEYKDGSRQVCELPQDKEGWMLKNWEKAIAKGYLAPSEESEEIFQFTDKPQPFCPSIHMPKEACRIFLRVKSVRVERLQDISHEDSLSEGIIEYNDGTFKNYFTKKGLRESDGVECLLPNGSFQSLWSSINGIESWKANPWVWVIEFERIEKPEGFL